MILYIYTHIAHTHIFKGPSIIIFHRTKSQLIHLYTLISMLEVSQIKSTSMKKKLLSHFIIHFYIIKI